jgi:glycerate-2-kinase
MDSRQTATEIFLAGLEGVKPDNLIKRFISIEQYNLQIENFQFDLSTIANIYIVGVGKASAAMAKSIESIFGRRITEGHIITKYEHSVPLHFIGITEAGHPVPDENGIKGTELIMSIAKKAEKNDLMICLISGGGSALLTDVPEGCSLDDLKDLNNILLKSGATIFEMNCIRKHLSKVKGGLLAKTAYPSRVVSLILSDVIGDPLDVIASGPTAHDPTTYADAISIINKYNIKNEIPIQIYQLLEDGVNNKRQETLKESDEALQLTSNLIIGTNKLALKIAKEKAELFGYETKIITDKIEGNVMDVAKYIMDSIKNAKKENIHKKSCLLFAGETTIKVEGDGLGGRNQHLALVIAKLLKDEPGITFLSAGTDGTDGPTDAAGAVVDSFTSQTASDLQLNMEQYINNCDSYHFFQEVRGLVKTGPTQTNVMDLMVALVCPQKTRLPLL